MIRFLGAAIALCAISSQAFAETAFEAFQRGFSEGKKTCTSSISSNSFNNFEGFTRSDSNGLVLPFKDLQLFPGALKSAQDVQKR